MPDYDAYGLIKDPEGDYTLTAGYSASDPDIAALQPGNAYYLPGIDDDTADNSSPISPFEKSYRQRLRKKRAIVKKLWAEMMADLAKLDFEDQAIQISYKFTLLCLDATGA